MGNIFVIARATNGLITRQAFYYLLLFILAVLIYMSQTLVLFAFSYEANMIREMGIATISLWGLIIVVVMSQTIVTAELEDRTAVTLLSKPIKKSEFLLGKLFGVLLSIFFGVLFLTAILILTIWDYTHAELFEGTGFIDAYKGGMSIVEFTYRNFFIPHAFVILEGAFLSFLQCAVLSAVCISLAAFFPMLVTVATTMLIYILGNLSTYIKVGLGKADSLPLTAIGNFFYYLLPNFGYFNLQTAFSEGNIISFKYLLFASIYGVVYIAIVLTIATAIFNRREIR